MVPLTGILYEFKEQENVIRAEAKKLFEEVGDSIDFKVGTMIEIPRAALTADRIASSAEFFSFECSTQDGTCLHLCNFRISISQTATTVTQHRVMLTQ